MSEDHCAATDFNNYLYTWGIEEHGELGYYDENEKKVCEPIKVFMNKKPFLVNRIKCGKNYTAGISNKGIPFIFGNKKNRNENRDINDDIIFFSFNNDYNYDLIAKDIYCGEEYLIILLEKEKILIYSFNDGLFEIKLNNTDNQINYIISKINIVDKNFYILDEKNKYLFEYVYISKSYNKPFNINDFYQNEYEVNPDIKLSIIEMPFFVKFLFFWIECSENEKKDFNTHKNKMFYKLNEKNFHHTFNKGPNINEYILFGNNKKKIQLIKVEYENLFYKKEKHFLLKGDYISSHQRNNEYKNNININININNVDASFQSLNIPISKNYGNRNDAKEYNKNICNYDNQRNSNTNTINNEENINKIDNNNINNRKSTKYNYNYGYRIRGVKYSMSQDKKRTDMNNSEYENEEKEPNINKNNDRKANNNKNIHTLDNNEINNISLTSNKIKEKNSFLIKNKSNFNTNDNIKDNNYNYNYNQIPIKNNKKRSCSQMKEEKYNHNYHNISSITTNANYSKKEDNDFDNILKNINSRKLLLNHPVKIENNVLTSKKILAQIGKTKSKTELLIKELQETFFGKDNNNINHKYNNNNNHYSNYTNKIDSRDESNEIDILSKEKMMDEKILTRKWEKKDLLLNIDKDEKEEKEKREKLEKEEKIKKEIEEKEKKKKEERLRIERQKMEKEQKEKEKIEKERKEKELLELKIKEENKRLERLRKEKEEREKKIKEEKERERLRLEKERKEREEKEKIERNLKKEKEQKELIEKLNKEKEERVRIEKERIEKEKIEKERIKKERERMEKERIEKERIEKERERKENERMEKERERIEKERIKKERIEKERMEREKMERERIERERIEKEEREKINQMRLEKEKLEKEIKEIIEKKEKENLIKEKLEKERIEKEKMIKEQMLQEAEEKKRKEELLEKELREKLENEYKEKYEKEKMRKEEEQKKEKEKLEKIEKEKNDKINQEKKITLEKIKELEKKKDILEKLEKEKKYMEEQRKNLLITSEINNFIEGNNKDMNKDISKFLPERLKTENENRFIMKGIDKKSYNYNYTISGNQQFNIENHQMNNINNISEIKRKNIDNIDINSNSEFNLNIEDIISNRDIIFNNNINNNNNISEKIESLEEENKNLLNDLSMKLNKGNISPINKISDKQLSSNETKKKTNENKDNNINNENKVELNNHQKMTSSKDLQNKDIRKNSLEKKNINIEDNNENSLKFAIEDNKADVYLSKDREKEDSLEMTNISNIEKGKEKEINNKNISDEENDNDAPETVLELEENKKKLNFNWKEKSKNRISEIIEEKQELEMIQSIDDTLQNKNNKNENNMELPLPYNNIPDQPIVPVSEISTNNMRHISTYDQNVNSSTRKFEPKELDDITGSLRLFSNRSANNNLFSMNNNKNNNNKPISQRTKNNLNINSNNNSTNLKPFYGIPVKNKNLTGQNLLKNENLNILNESYKETNPNENIKDQKMKIDDLEQSKRLKESKNITNKNNNNNFEINNNKSNINKFEEEIKDNKNIKLNKIIKLKNKEELNNILLELKKIEQNKNENETLDDSLYFLLENDMEESNNNIQNSYMKNSQIIKVKNNKITKFDSDSNSFKNENFFNNNINNFKNNLFTNLNNINNFNNMNNANNFNNIIINNDNNFNNINYINDIKNNNRLININNNTHNNHTFKEISNFRDNNNNNNKYINEEKYERHTYVPKSNINIFNNNEPHSNQYERNNNMMKGTKIKIMHKNQSHGKENHKKHRKKIGIIEQIKKEQSEKKNNNMYSTFNNRNKNILMVNNGTPYSNSKTQAYSKNSIAKIDYNNNAYQYEQSYVNMMNDNNNKNYIHHNKSKSVNINKCLSCSPKKKYEDFSKYKFNQPEKNNFYIYDNNNINNNNFIINKTNNYNDEEFKNIINMNKIKQEQENNSFILLRQKYLEFLLKTYGNNKIPLNKENEELDNIFLKGLVKNEVPIENINLNLLKCSNDMKNFIYESLENFKLQQLKEKLVKVNNNKKSFLNNNIDKNNENKNNNLNGLIQLDYEDEIKDKSNILEPIELDKSNYNLNFRKSFIESLSGIRNENTFYNSENIIKK